ncbi:MAG: hypothetical protein ACPGXK_08115 [Phycisphaerae bacterium]
MKKSSQLVLVRVVGLAGLIGVICFGLMRVVLDAQSRTNFDVYQKAVIGVIESAVFDFIASTGDVPKSFKELIDYGVLKLRRNEEFGFEIEDMNGNWNVIRNWETIQLHIPADFCERRSRGELFDTIVFEENPIREKAFAEWKLRQFEDELESRICGALPD